MEYWHLLEVHWHTALQPGGSCWGMHTSMSGRLGLADGDANSRRAPTALREVSEEAVRYSGEKLAAKSIEGFSHLPAHRPCIATCDTAAGIYFPFVFQCPDKIPDIAHIAITRFSFQDHRPVAVDGGSKWSPHVLVVH